MLRAIVIPTQADKPLGFVRCRQAESILVRVKDQNDSNTADSPFLILTDTSVVLDRQKSAKTIFRGLNCAVLSTWFELRSHTNNDTVCITVTFVLQETPDQTILD